MTKLTKTHVTIKENQVDRIIKFLNKSKTMVDYIRTTHDVRLSDVRKLEEGMDELADMFDLFVPEVDHTGSPFDHWEDVGYCRKPDNEEELNRARGRSYLND